MSWVLGVPKVSLRQLVTPLRPHAPEPASEDSAAAEDEVKSPQVQPYRVIWARPLERAIDLELQHCGNCGGGELTIIAPILDRPLIEQMLTQLGLDAQSPRTRRARGIGKDWSPLEPSTVCKSRRMFETERRYRLKNLLDAGRCLTKVELLGTFEISRFALKRNLAHLRDRRTRRSPRTATDRPGESTTDRLCRRTSLHARHRSIPGRARALLSRPHED